MDLWHAHLDGMSDAPRLLYRTRHIFILITALACLGIGAYLTPAQSPEARVCQWTGGVLIVVAGGLFLAGFFYEPAWADLETPLSHWGAYAVAAGVLLHVAAANRARSG